MTLSPSDLHARATRIRLACFDVDGTLTDGRLGYDGDGRESKAFHVHDGLGLKLLMQSGVEVALITARNSAIVSARATELGVGHVLQGVTDKRATLLALCDRLGLAPERCAYMGDDLPDLEALRAAGLSAAPADAHPWIAERVDWRARRPGGNGAAREFCDLLLAARGAIGRLLAPETAS